MTEGAMSGERRSSIAWNMRHAVELCGQTSELDRFDATARMDSSSTQGAPFETTATLGSTALVLVLDRSHLICLMTVTAVKVAALRSAGRQDDPLETIEYNIAFVVASTPRSVEAHQYGRPRKGMVYYSR